MLDLNLLLLVFSYLNTAATSATRSRQIDTNSTLFFPILTTTANTTPLLRSKHDLQSSSRALRAAQISNLSGSALLKTTGSSFLAEITLGSQTFLSVVDTGSSDTWIARSDFTCVDIITNATKPQSKCYFGGTYTPDNQFHQIANENFNITYGDGEYLTGPVGTISVTLANVRVPSQQVSLATLAAWEGDGQTSGIIGLAYPALTAAYPGTDPRVDKYCKPGATPQNSGCNQVEYSSLTNTIFFSERLTAPVFALALSRDESNSGNGGYLSIGGIPPLDLVGVKSGVFASTPIKVLPGDSKFRYYLISIDGLVMLPAGTPLPAEGASKLGVEVRSKGSGRRPRPHPHTSSFSNAVTPSSLPVTPNSQADYILDSGTTLSFFPSQMTTKYNAMFNPPATLDPYTGFWLVKCGSSPPPLGVKIGGQVFFHNGKELVKQFDATRCVSGIQDSGRLGGVNILGDVFLDNVLAVFDLTQGNSKVWFAGRRDYMS
ncbi:hypothetical protein H2198_008309 [Neophaeococcomyces mojaviensis]|uniref:Uncharacterized protein n=1 Tax=Neophaeococcomyces mojaviensis TaxID=3383035 RepID=A0ACC2ZXL5_9EURO|nr:hypothetical protein H2198_008309 [Knufia sp. JES_112]